MIGPRYAAQFCFKSVYIYNKTDIIKLIVDFMHEFGVMKDRLTAPLTGAGTQQHKYFQPIYIISHPQR